MTIRETIQDYSERLRSADNLSPDEASNILIELTSLFASLNAEIASKEYEYNVVLCNLIEGSKSVSEAKIRAMATIQYRDWRERTAWGKSLEEVIRSVKVFIKSAIEERKSQYDVRA